MIDLCAIREALLGPAFEAQAGDYAQLVDEDDEQGMVGIYREDGTLVMVMPRETWDHMRKGER